MWRKAILTFTGLCGAWFGYTLYQRVGGIVSWMPEWLSDGSLPGMVVWMMAGAVLFIPGAHSQEHPWRTGCNRALKAWYEFR